jgi:hypothetical protein
MYIRKLGGIIEKLKKFKINGDVEEAVKIMTEECSLLEKAIP